MRDRSKQPHILFLLSTFGIGGAEIDVLNLSNELIRRGYQITIASQGGALEKKLHPKVRTLHIPIASPNFFVSLSNAVVILFYTLFYRVTLLNPQSIKGVLVSRLVQKILHIPMVSTIHNLQNPIWLKMSANLLNRVPDVTLFVSKYERQRFIRSGLKAEISRVTYSGLPLEKFPDATNQPTTGHIGIFGRLSPEKGVDIGIRSFAQLTDTYPYIQLIIVGNGQERHMLEMLTEELGIKERVQFLGERQDIPQLLASIDFLLLPSRSESLSVVARESMAVGKPVISANVGGMPELIIHHKTGQLVEANNVGAFTQAIQHWLVSPDQRRLCGQKAQHTIKNQFSLVHWVDQMESIYRHASGMRLSVREKRNILFVTTRLPFPLDKGDKLRAYHQIRELSKKHAVFLLSLTESPDDLNYLPELEKYCTDIATIPLDPEEAIWRRRIAHLTLRPSQLNYFWSKELHTLLPKVVLSWEIDTVFAQLIRGGQYVKRLNNVWRIIDFVDAFSLNLKRNCQATPVWWHKLISCPRGWKIASYEQRLLPLFNKKFIISAPDRAALKDDTITLTPNGTPLSDEALFPVIHQERAIIFTGQMNYWPNEDAASYLVRRILPLLPKDVLVYLVGINNNPAVHKLASDRVIVTGRVPSVTQRIRQVAVAVCPMRLGAGQQNKILEAMAAGTPVVASSIANGSIGAPPDCILVADDPATFAQKICQLLDDPLGREKQRNAAHTFVHDHFDWVKVVKHMETHLWDGEIH